jgi:clan AA aspartic protease
MIVGAVNGDLEPIVRLRVLGHHGEERDLEFVLDTGFNGFVILPPDLVSEFGYERVCIEFATLADGREEAFDVYRARILWDGQPRDIEADVANAAPLIGMAMLEGHDLQVRVAAAGEVKIQVVP